MARRIEDDRELKQRRRRRQRERQQSNRFRLEKKTTLHVYHAFLYISLPSLHDYNVKVPKFTFSRGREHKTTTFYLFSWTLIQSFKIQLQEHLKRDGISAIKFKAERIHFLSLRRRCSSSLSLRVLGHLSPLLTWTTLIKRVWWLIVPPFFQYDNEEITNSFLRKKNSQKERKKQPKRVKHTIRKSSVAK